ncbi:hypothetical protein LY28_03748 [Ruminiclostridium sufflavum DSM 19573]|uniref:Uncharacterized protein n=1 Tax=Ruminiclostridium sufflavum DSM 19573 TaxID=1121337 RepID=A0A318XFG5_9FIRM|nr:hypothetical protein LY28_03748 [Ruminiclostridium sufflavum DSM 19573]
MMDSVVVFPPGTRAKLRLDVLEAAIAISVALASERIPVALTRV